MIPRQAGSRRHVRLAAALLLTLSLAAHAASATLRSEPLPTALLPAVGPASEEERRDLDGALRQALLDANEIDLLSPVETRQQLLSLAEMGLVCLAEDVPCLVKLGLVSNVAWVLVPVMARPAGRTVVVEIGVIDVAAAKRVRTVEGKVSLDDESALEKLARRAMGLAEATPPDKPPDPPPDVEAPPSEGEGEGAKEKGGAAADVAPSPGVIVAGIGGVVAGVSLVSATVVELVFANVIQADKDTRRNIQPFGAVLWGTTALGALAVGAGIYLLTEEPAP